MVRTKMTARRGKAFHTMQFLRPPYNIARSHQDHASGLIPGAESMVDAVGASDTEFQAQPQSRCPGELPDTLICFVAESDMVGPQLKRRKVQLVEKKIADQDANGSEQHGLDHIVVRRSVMDIRCLGSKLLGFDLPMTKNIQRFAGDGAKGHKTEAHDIAIMDDCGRRIFVTPLPVNPEQREIVCHALAIHRVATHKWSRGEGKLWTELDLVLYRQSGADYVQLKFTIKWNLTTSPDNIVQQASKIPVFTNAISAFFPDPDATLADSWSPLDFYQSAHVTEKDNDNAPRIEATEVTLKLYPFQKRAVQWLLGREGVEWCNGTLSKIRSNPQRLPISFSFVEDQDGRKFYVSHLFGLITLDPAPFLCMESALTGGILAEEMGLGKTIEILSLICLHTRPDTFNPSICDERTGESVKLTSATLIITPASILQQWLSELSKHAASLKVFHYEGVKGHDCLNAQELLDTLSKSNVVVTSYSVLQSEVYFTKLNPEKSLRQKAKYPRPKSPLMLLSWWRVCLDEAQMIESGISNSAILAQMIPRVNAWAISGTPVRKNVDDLRGLLMFLRCSPYAFTPHVWLSLISTHKPLFRILFGRLALRHSKQSVRNELRLPAQRRYVITMPFTLVEEQYYREIYTQMCEMCGLDTTGTPSIKGWELEDYAEHMRRFLLRLRQTALHAEVGSSNRGPSARKIGSLRTVGEVLDAMVEQTELAIRTDHRSLLVNKLKRGQLFENSPRVREALEIWRETADETSSIVEDYRAQLRLEFAKDNPNHDLDDDDRGRSGTDSETLNTHDADPSNRIGILKARLRNALEIQHMAIFFCANGFFQIKSNGLMTEPDSDDYKRLDQLETDHYELAKTLRREILQDIFCKADRQLQAISKHASAQSFVKIPAFPSHASTGGLESRKLIEQLDALGLALDAQASQLDEWRKQTIQLLLRPLVDEDDGLELTGDEYEDSKKTQDEVMIYVQAIRSVIADRYDALTGQINFLIEHEAEHALNLAKKGEGPFPEKTIELLATRYSIKPTQDMGSLRGIIAEFRSLATMLRADTEQGNVRALVELEIVEAQLRKTQKQLSEQTKATTALEKEVEAFTNAMNTRLEYYRQLQQVSDMVAPHEGFNDHASVVRFLEDEEKLVQKITITKSKRRYLLHLKTEATNPQVQRICVICRESFEVGAMTVCGHQFCKECIRHWWATHHNCPVCKKKLVQADLHYVTYKPKEMSIHSEGPNWQQSLPSSASRTSAIFSEISKSKLAQIKNIELEGPSFSTKVDTLARHLIWLRESDPGSKSIIYSQFKDFLDILGRAFTRFRIGFISVDKPNGIACFKRDPGIECFLLHARAHSSGLNLVEASHVFLCEPLLNAALELQAIARVDRIGQMQETNVWLYLINGTVEESIHQLSVKRRMEHIGLKTQNSKGKGKDITQDGFSDVNLEQVNSMELQQASLTGLLGKGPASGELVKNEDLWECIFGAVSKGYTKDGEAFEL